MMTLRSLVILLIIIFIPFLGIKDFYSRGESREALVAQRMALTENYLLPDSYNGTVPSKPPFLHWLINGCSKVFGGIEINEFISRLPSALFAIIGAIVLFQFLLKKTGSIDTAWLAAVILGTSLNWFRCGISTRVDMVLSVAVLVALLEFYKWHERKFSGYPWIGVCSLTAAALTKGPVGIALPACIFGTFLWIENRGFFYSGMQVLKVVLPAVVLASFWYVACYYHYGEVFLDKVYYENISRLTSDMADEPHRHGIFYLYFSVIVGFLPWSIPSIISVFKIRSSSWKVFINSPFHRFLSLWVIFFLLFFAIPESKRDTYLLPAYPAVAYFVSLSLTRLSRELQVYCSKFFLFGAISFIASVPVMLLIGNRFFGFFLTKNLPQSEWLAEYFQAHVLIVIAACLGASYLLLKGTKEEPGKSLFTKIVYSLVSILVVIQAFYAPGYANAISYKNPSVAVAPVTTNEEKLFSFADEFYGISFYLKKPFFSVPVNEDKNVPLGVVFLYEHNLPSLKNKLIEGKQCIDIVYRSNRPVIKSKDHLLAVRVLPCNYNLHE